MPLSSLLSVCYKPLLVSASLVPLALLFTTISSSSAVLSSDLPLPSAPSIADTVVTSSLLALHNLTAMTSAASSLSSSSLSSLSSLASSVPSSASSLLSSPLSSSSSFLSSFLSSLCLIFMAEFGDKTFLSTLFVSSSLPASTSLLSAESLTLLFGSNAAAATLAVLSAALSTVSASVSTSWGLTLLRGVASAACVFFGLQMLYETYRDSCSNEQQPTADCSDKTASPLSSSTAASASASSSSIVSLFVHTYCMALATEMGDHSQFSFLLLTSHPSAPSALPIVLGGVLGHVLCTMIAIVGGGWVVRLGWHERQIRWVGGGLFLAMALVQMVW